MSISQVQIQHSIKTDKYTQFIMCKYTVTNSTAFTTVEFSGHIIKKLAPASQIPYFLKTFLERLEPADWSRLTVLLLIKGFTIVLKSCLPRL